MASYGGFGGRNQFRRQLGITNHPSTPRLLSMANGQPHKGVIPSSQMTEAQVADKPEDSDDEISEPATPRKSPKGAKKPGFDKTSDAKPARSQDARETTNDADSDEEYAAKKARDSIASVWGGNSKAAREQRAFSASQESKLGLKGPGSSEGSSLQTRSSKRSSPDLSSPSPPRKKSRAWDSKIEESKGKKLKSRIKPPKTFSRKENKVLQNRDLQAQRKKAEREAKEARKLTPEKKMPSFKSYDDDPFEKFDVKASPTSFVKPNSLLSSPMGSPRKKFVVHSSLSPGSSPEKTTTAKFQHPSASLSQSPKKLPAKPGDLVPIPKFPVPMLKDPFAELSDLDMSEESADEVLPATSPCPICKKPVDRDTLDSFFSGGGRLKINKQLQFHRQHAKKEAQDIWKNRGFPEIDWDEISIRLTDHYDFLEEIIKGGHSHYGTLLIDTVKEGKNRTLMKAQSSLTPGYYGPRGLRALSEDIIARFSSLLRERAVDDRLISSRGYSSYVEAVLVPELAVRLICEDMSVEPAEARDILEESKEVGDLLQEDIGDTVDQASDDERDDEY